MKNGIFRLGGVLVVILAVVFIARTSGAPVFPSLSVDKTKMDKIVESQQFIECLKATGTRLDQIQMAGLAVLNKLIDDPLRCNLPAISQERLDGLIDVSQDVDKIAYGSEAMKKLICPLSSSDILAIGCEDLARLYRDDDMTSQIEKRIQFILCEGRQIKVNRDAIERCASD